MESADQRAPGVSAALRNRIGTLLGGGATVSLRRNNLVLRDIVLTRANGTEAPAAAEMRLQVARRGLAPANFSLERWDRGAAVEQAGNRTFAVDRDGNRHLVSMRRNGQRVVTNAGRRFYQDAPQTQWIVNVPVISVRGTRGGTFNPRYIPITDAFLQAMEDQGRDVRGLSDLRWTRDGADAEDQVQRMLQRWRDWFWQEFDRMPEEFMDSPEADDRDVTTLVDHDRPFTYDVQRTGVTGSGALSVDTMLDQVVFGNPVTSHDIWMKCHLHEGSRRRNGECGIDVIVASSSWRQKHADGSRTTQSMFNADQVVTTLVAMAKKDFPDSAWAQACSFEEPQDHSRTLAAMEVDATLRSRGLVKTPGGLELQKKLEPYLPKMLIFLQKPRTLDEIAANKGNIYQQTAKQKKTGQTTMPVETLLKALTKHISWSTDPQHRLLTFLRLFKCKIELEGETFVAKDSKKRVQLPPEAPSEEVTAAREALRQHGTPMRLLEMFLQEDASSPRHLSGRNVSLRAHARRLGHARERRETDGRPQGLEQSCPHLQPGSA